MFINQNSQIKTLYVHPDYKGNLQKFRDDIALVEVDAEFIPSLEVQAACVDWDYLYEGFDFVEGKEAVVSVFVHTIIILRTSSNLYLNLYEED